ncbi:TAXI family TRAP transporter solute-binding subunit [Roseovarius sp.]|uniref:TAXI family TRAP transporter solute-binding subunit n=1 Tax=Roseovarius sp. TaxID=1486281 RepID=UPI0035664620
MTFTRFTKSVRAFGARFALCTALAATPAAAQDVTIGGGSIGGTWSLVGNAIAEYIRKEIPGVQPTVLSGGGVKNLLGLSIDQLQLGFAYSSSAAEAIEGIGPFEGRKMEATAIAGLYMAGWQLTVPKNSGIETVEDLKGKNIAPGIKGFTGEVIARMVLDVYDMSYDDLDRVEFIGYNDAVQLIKDGHLDAFMPIAADPTASIQDLASSSSGVNIVPIPDDKLDAIREINPGYVRYTIEAGTYRGQDEDVGTLGTNTVIYAAPNLDPELVEKIMEVIANHIDDLRTLHPLLADLTLAKAVEDLGAPLHPGARAFYEKQGLQ